jgi:hypothetical protein
VSRGWGHPGTGHRTVSVTPCRATWRRVCGARREHKSPGQPLAGGRARSVDARCTTLGDCRYELPPAGGAPRRAPSQTVVRWWTLPWWNPSVVADSPAGTAHRQSSQDGGGHGSTVHPCANDLYEAGGRCQGWGPPPVLADRWARRVGSTWSARSRAWGVARRGRTTLSPRVASTTVSGRRGVGWCVGGCSWWGTSAVSSLSPSGGGTRSWDARGGAIHGGPSRRSDHLRRLPERSPRPW